MKSNAPLDERPLHRICYSGSQRGSVRSLDNAHAERTNKKALPHDNAFSQHKK